MGDIMSHDLPSGAISMASVPKLTAACDHNTGGLDEGGIAKSESCKKATAIDVLPEDVFLRIFDFCRMGRNRDEFPPRPVWEWHRLARVCRRWRQIVFAFPRRLDIQIFCTQGTPVKKNLGFWPAFPIAIDYCIYHDSKFIKITEDPTSEDYDNAITALELPGRVCSIRLTVTRSLLEKMAVVLQRPFPVLTSLMFQLGYAYNEPAFTGLTDAFLGGSAPRLQKVDLDGMHFPTFPTFLRSARDLVKLRLVNIPQIGSISPGMIVAGLGALTKLEDLHISFTVFDPLLEWLDSRPTRIVLPVLTVMLFVGTRKYLEEFFAQIETPQLAELTVRIFPHDPVVQVPQLFQFISRAERLNRAMFRRARIHVGDSGSHLGFDQLDRSQGELGPCFLDLKICYDAQWQAPCLIQLLGQSSPIISNVRHLSIASFYEFPMRCNTSPAEWLMFLRPFNAVESLRICDQLVIALENSTEDMIAEMLPALQSLNLERQPLTFGALKKFIAARQLSGRPVTVDNPRKNFPCGMCYYLPQYYESDPVQEDGRLCFQDRVGFGGSLTTRGFRARNPTN